MDSAEMQDIVRDLEEYRKQVRELKLRLIEFEAMLTFDKLNRESRQ